MPKNNMTKGTKIAAASYHELVKNGKIKSDPIQLKLIEKLDVIIAKITGGVNNKSAFGRIFKKENKPVKGLYIYGNVGRGKSMLMDLFYHNLPVEKKMRSHFHNFMLDIHARLNARKKSDKKEADPLPKIAKEIANNAEVLCFDEFQVADIADAMILGRLFESLFNEGVIVIATSNRPPDELYKDGLQRNRFLPFIEMLKNRLDIVELNSPHDYRLQHLKSLSTMYFAPLGQKADKFINDSFAELTNGAKAKSQEINVNGRKLLIRKMHGDVASFSFEELCANALGAADYIEISREFRTIILSDIPRMNKDMRNEAKRFTTLIDELYEHKCNLICTAEVPPEELYITGDNAFEFQRAVSRLVEMQSENYLSQEHVTYN